MKVIEMLRIASFFFMAQALAATGAHAQQRQVQVSLPPLPESAGGDAAPRLEECDAVNCVVEPAQLSAMDSARRLYSADKLAAAAYSVVIGKEGSDLAITLVPSPIGARGRAVTYVFDRSGKTLKRSYLNR